MRKTKEWFVCEHCGLALDEETAYEAHLLKHDIVYVGLERSVWKELVQTLHQAYWLGVPIPKEVMDKLTEMKLGVTQ
jgi:phage-related holin